MEAMENKQKYTYPIGDFLSGFSEDEKNPCDYELECQRMVIRGVEYLDDNNDIVEKVELGGVKVSDEILKPMIKFMCLNEENPKESDGQTGAMVDHTVRVAFGAKKLGWENYIEKITSVKN